MRYFFIILIVLIFGSIGYSKKQKIKEQKKLIDNIKNYIAYYDSNLSVFKNDLLKINKEYLIMQNNKNANNELIKIKNNNIIEFNYEFLQIKLSNIPEIEILITYFKMIGTSEFEDEKTKNIETQRVLDALSKRLNDEIKTKGDLMFKVLLAVGAVVAIIIW